MSTNKGKLMKIYNILIKWKSIKIEEEKRKKLERKTHILWRIRELLMKFSFLSDTKIFGGKN